MSLRSRFVTTSSCIALLTLSGAFAAVWFANNAAQEQQLDVALLAEATSDAIDTSYAPSDSAPARLVLRKGDLGLITKYAVIYGEDGHEVTWTANLEAARPRIEIVRRAAGVPFDFWWNNEHLRAVWMHVPNDGGLSLWLATPRSNLDRRAAYLARRMGLAVLAGVMASALATSWVGRLLTRDHVRIASAARAVAAGDLSARARTSSGDSEVAQLGRDIDEMISRLAVLVETQQRFIANASHELRSPITTLLGELSLALRRDRDAAAYRNCIREALDSARRLKELAENLLALARAGAASLEAEAVSLPDVARAALEQTTAAAANAGVTLEVSCSPGTVRGRSGDLERLVRNLLENAIRHSPAGGRVRVEARCDDAGARVVVSDEGPGVPAEARERIFEPFFRLTARQGDQAGAGLGLALGRSIARAHGGDLWVDDTKPDARGARFVVHLPVCGTGSAAGAS
jgi:two-component system, OmpR family, sensor kinase